VCGITGGFFKEAINVSAAEASIQSLRLRGPDHQQVAFFENWFLGHARLAIIDLSTAAQQPMSSACGRYSLVYNGEIYNFRRIRTELEALGHSFQTESDTEVLLVGLVQWGKELLPRLNGFFAFAFFDRSRKVCLLGRDRMGIKPLWLCRTEQGCFFGSEHKALRFLGMGPDINPTAVRAYFRMGYIPGPLSIYSNGYQLMPGHWVELSEQGFGQPTAWWSLPETLQEKSSALPSYDEACFQVKKIVEDAVTDRLVSDVPLGSFLSGGVDSSIVVSVAAKRLKGLHTFSIGFKDQPYFDETRHAEHIAKLYGTNHTTFRLSNQDLLSHVPEMLQQLDMPFADSSALPVFILSKETKKHVTVSLSGDGGDELFSGYHKHAGEWAIRNDILKRSLAILAHPLTQKFKGSRSGILGNAIRQINKFHEGSQKSAFDRYRSWAGVVDDAWVDELVLQPDLVERELDVLRPLIDGRGTLELDFNAVLEADLRMVLPFDMLTKVDLMSMANSLEVRVPLLDYRLIQYVQALPSSYKIDGKRKKKLLIDAFKHELPQEIWKRRKQGFEVPLLPWFRGELRGLLKETLDLEKIKTQKILNPDLVARELQRLDSKDPGELHFKLWSLFVWQNWFDKTMSQ
jgi:asparagine synthase (glutamine-hydrolysing)